MTIVQQQEIMNPDLEAELDDGDHDIDEYDGDFDGEEDVAEGGSEVDAVRPGAGNPDVAEWMSLENHPPPTVARIVHCMRRVASRGRNTLTILVLGRSGNGKSSTVNSIFGSTVAQAVPFHVLTLQAVQPLVVRKRLEGVTLTVIDTAGPIESDNSLKRIAYQARHHPVDVVLFVDRFDMPSVDELDLQLMTGLTRVFGSEIWSRVVIGLTHADIRDPIPDQTYDSMIRKRVSAVREVMRRAGSRDAALPYVLIENSERCRRNSTGEKVLENGTVWVPAFFETISNVAQSFPSAYKYNPKMVNRHEHLIAKFIIIPLMLVAQIICKVYLLDAVIHGDGLRGDSYGPFEQSQREYEQRRQDKRKSKAKQQKSSSSSKTRDLSLEDELSDGSEDEFED